MYYIKSKQGDFTICTEIKSNTIYTVCPKCQREFDLDISELITEDGIDLVSTSAYCDECSKEIANC